VISTRSKTWIPQRGEVQRLQETRRHWGEVGAAIDGARSKVIILDHEWVTDADIAAATINRRPSW
jgi:hypothetical protein